MCVFYTTHRTQDKIKLKVNIVICLVASCVQQCLYCTFWFAISVFSNVISQDTVLESRDRVLLQLARTMKLLLSLLILYQTAMSII